MAALTNTPCSLLLLGLLALAALGDRRQRRHVGAPPIWWRPVARAFLGARVFFVLTVWQFWLWRRCGVDNWLFGTYVKYGVYRWGPTALLEYPMDPALNTGQCIRFLSVLAGTMLMLSDIWRRSQSRLRAPGNAISVLVKAALLLGAAVALWNRWWNLEEVTPDILRVFFRISIYFSDDLILVGDSSRRGLFVAGLECFAQTALVL